MTQAFLASYRAPAMSRNRISFFGSGSHECDRIRYRGALLVEYSSSSKRSLYTFRSRIAMDMELRQHRNRDKSLIEASSELAVQPLSSSAGTRLELQ